MPVLYFAPPTTDPCPAPAAFQVTLDGLVNKYFVPGFEFVQEVENQEKFFACDMDQSVVARVHAVLAIKFAQQRRIGEAARSILAANRAGYTGFEPSGPLYKGPLADVINGASLLNAVEMIALPPVAGVTFLVDGKSSLERPKNQPFLLQVRGVDNQRYTLYVDEEPDGFALPFQLPHEPPCAQPAVERAPTNSQVSYDIPTWHLGFAVGATVLAPTLATISTVALGSWLDDTEAGTSRTPDDEARSWNRYHTASMAAAGMGLAAGVLDVTLIIRILKDGTQQSPGSGVPPRDQDSQK